MGNNVATLQSTGSLSEDRMLEVLKGSLYPGARDDSIRMVLDYCHAAGLDPMQKPVHIVPMWVKDPATGNGAMRDTVMPGIGLYRVQAARSKEHAGTTEPEFGPEVTAQLGTAEITYPQWCRVTVYRLMRDGQVVPYTAKEFWLENYATASKDTEAPNTMWRKRKYGQLAKCFDGETEILTTDGFQKFSEVTGSIMQVSDTGLEPTDAKPFDQEYDGEMIVADGSRLNFAVTPNHDMLTTAGKIEAGDMYEQATTSPKFHIPRTLINRQAGINVSDQAIRLAGYFLADGSHTGHRQFRIAVSRPRKISSLREVGLFSREAIRHDKGGVGVLDGRAIETQVDKTVFTYAFDQISDVVTPEKRLATANLSERQARILVDAVLEFDGCDNGNGTRRLIQTNRNVIAAFEVSACLAGYSVSRRSHGDGSMITISEADNFPVIRLAQKAQRNNTSVAKNNALVKRKNVAGRVWCVTVPSGVIMVRRHGFSMLCGNCTEAQALRKAFPEFGAAPTAEEMEGKDLVSARDVTPPRQARGESLPPYPQETLDANKEKYRQVIQSGKKSPEQIIAMIETKGTLTDDQKRQIHNLTVLDAEEATDANA